MRPQVFAKPSQPVLPVFETIPLNALTRQQHSQYPRMWLDNNFNVKTWDADAQLTNGVESSNYIFVSITVPSGMRAIVYSVAFDVVMSAIARPPITDRLFMRNRQVEQSRFTYDRFTNNIRVQAPQESFLGDLGGSYENPNTVSVYDFGNSGDTLTYAVRARTFNTFGQVPCIMSANSFVEVDYVLLPPNNQVYTSAQA